jgi:ribosome-associated toxin RatA of RatAB toxin-antitoxin module
MRHPSLQRPFRLAAVLIALLVPAPLCAGAPDVEVSFLPVGKDTPREGIATGRIAAPPERVFRAVVDVAHWHEFMPFLEASDARPQPDGSVLSEQLLDLPFPLGSRHYQIRLRSRAERTPGGPVWQEEWSYVPGSGNLKGLRGSWTLVPTADGATLATCHLWTDPGSLSSGLMDRATAKSLAWIFDGLRQHVRRSRYDRP